MKAQTPRNNVALIISCLLPTLICCALPFGCSRGRENETDKTESVKKTTVKSSADNNTDVKNALTETPALPPQTAAFIANVEKRYAERMAAEESAERRSDEELAEAALNGDHISIRYKAVGQLTDQLVLAEVAIKESDEYTRITAFEKISDQKALMKVAENAAARSCIAGEAYRKLTEESIILLAKNSTNEALRFRAISDMGVKSKTAEIAEIAKGDESANIRAHAVKLLTDQTVLAEIAKNDKDANPRAAAVEKLMDQAALAEVARNDEDTKIRASVVGRLTIQTVLEEIAQNDKDAGIRRSATERLTNQTVLAKIAQNAKNADVRLCAVEKLNNIDVLLSIAEKDSSKNVRNGANERLAYLLPEEYVEYLDFD